MRNIRKVERTIVNLGCDPEFFFTKKGKVIGSEEVIKGATKGVVRDGVQAELNPDPSTCRDSLNHNIHQCLSNVRAMKGKEVDVSLETTVEVDKENFDKLSDESKVSGCAPSLNTHGSFKVDVDKNDRRRWAGGHIHLGVVPDSDDYINQSRVLQKKSKEDINQLINLLDIMVGVFFIPIDSGAHNIERRKNYGRAGEYRLPPHGIEYRTPSNFWVKHPVLASAVFGMARHAVEIVESGLYEQVMRNSTMIGIDRVINENDVDGAFMLFERFGMKIAQTAPDFDSRYPLRVDTFHSFRRFLLGGIDPFTGDIFNNWQSPGFSNHRGISQYLTRDIYDQERERHHS